MPVASFTQNGKKNGKLSQQQLAMHLFNAYRNRQPIKKTQFIEGMSTEQAYQTQHLFTQQKIKAGARLAGYKISMTSPQTMALFHANEPMYGQLTNQQILTTSQNGNALQLSLNSQLIDPLIELELAFIIHEPLTVDDDIETICQKCLIAPALEVPDCRYQDWFANMSKEHLCVDGAVGGFLCLGQAVNMSAKQVAEEIGTLFYGSNNRKNHNSKDDESEKSDPLLTEPASVVLGHPAQAVQWLVKKLASHSLELSAGMVVSSGSFGMPVQLQQGTYVGQFKQAGDVRLEVV